MEDPKMNMLKEKQNSSRSSWCPEEQFIQKSKFSHYQHGSGKSAKVLWTRKHFLGLHILLNNWVVGDLLLKSKVEKSQCEMAWTHARTCGNCSFRGCCSYQNITKFITACLINGFVNRWLVHSFWLTSRGEEIHFCLTEAQICFLAKPTRPTTVR